MEIFWKWLAVNQIIISAEKCFGVSISIKRIDNYRKELEWNDAL